MGDAPLTLDPAEIPAGVFPAQLLRAACAQGWLGSVTSPVPDGNVQPASVDLRLGEVAYSLRCSFLPDDDVPVQAKLEAYALDELSLGDGAVLEVNRPYLVPLMEELRLPAGVRGKANPKSSTGRLDVFTRVVTDGNYRFDEIHAGYVGRMFLEIVPRSFPIRIHPGLCLNQLRLLSGSPRLGDDDIRRIHSQTPLLFSDGEAVPDEKLSVADGLFLRLDLRHEARQGGAGYQARKNRPVLDLSRVGAYEAADYWRPVFPESGTGSVILEPEEFYLLLSEETVQVPPFLAAEMMAYDPTAGELRTHYAGFFDPGFGFHPDEAATGSAAVLEVRAHDVPFLIEHGQRVCKLSFEHMAAPPDVLYGRAIGSSYQDQDLTLSKHFRTHGSRRRAEAGAR